MANQLGYPGRFSGRYEISAAGAKMLTPFRSGDKKATGTFVFELSEPAEQGFAVTFKLDSGYWMLLITYS